MHAAVTSGAGRRAKLREGFVRARGEPALDQNDERADASSATRVSWRPLSSHSEARGSSQSTTPLSIDEDDEDNDILAFWEDKRTAALAEARDLEVTVRRVWRRIDKAGKKLAQARLEKEQVDKELADTLETLSTSKDRLLQATSLVGLTGLSGVSEDWRPCRPAARGAKCGAVVTSHGLMGAYAQSCIGSLTRFLPEDSKIVLYVNEGKDPLFDMLPDRFPEVEIVRVDEQDEFGGLTGTWNDGIERCLAANCDVVLLVNGDTHVEANIVHLIDAAAEANSTGQAKVFGPVSNAPGPEGCNISQASAVAVAVDPFESHAIDKQGRRQFGDLNGFFLCFPACVLREFRHDEANVFDPSFPWNGNETEWWKSHCPRVYRARNEPGLPAISDGVSLWVVPKTFVFHHKQAAWRGPKDCPERHSADSIACYQVVTGGYDGHPSFSPRALPVCSYCYFLSDSPTALREAAQEGWTPLLIGPWVTGDGSSDPRRVQRCAKARPENILPAAHGVSVYTDGNCTPSQWSGGAAGLVEAFLPADRDLACWAHPRRATVSAESLVIKELGLDTPEAHEAAEQLALESEFQDDAGLTETCVLIRRHGHLEEFSREWVGLLSFCGRDQLFFDVLVAKHGVSVIKHPDAAKGTVVVKRNHDGPGSMERVACLER